MAANNRGAGSSGDSDVIYAVLMAALFVGLVVYFFNLNKEEFSAAWIFYARIEGYLTLYTSFDPAIKEQARLLIKWSNEVNPNGLTFEMYNAIRHKILNRGNHKYVIAGLMLIPPVFMYLKYRTFKGVPKLDSLLSTEHTVWPTLEFIRRFNPFDHWKELSGPGRYTVSPFTYCVENRCIKNYQAESKYDRILLEDALEEALKKAVGRKFTSYSDLSPFEMSLIALIAAKETEHFKLFWDMLRFQATTMADVANPAIVKEFLLSTYLPIMQLLDGNADAAPTEPGAIALAAALKANQLRTNIDRNEWLPPKKFLFFTIRPAQPNPETPKKVYGVHPSVLEVMANYKAKHAYVSTLIIGASREVKRKGKFPPGRLVFFKAWDRQLFLIISNSPYYVEDDHSPHVFISGFSSEVFGPFAHYQHEVFAGRKLDDIFVGTGVAGLKERLKQQNLIA